jgi:diguanylate cyclase (GGDEF)-like protein/PAS domain S-box-containing protein
MLVLTRDERGPVHRYMAPLRTTESCLQCHVERDFKVGEVRGGISMTMPAEPLLVLRDAQRLRVVGLFLVAFALASGLFHYLLVLTRRHLRAIARINAEQERLIVQRTSELAASNAGLAREVEQRRRDQRQLATSEARYRAIFDSTAEGLMLIDEEARIEEVNPAFTTITGYEAEEVRGHGLEVLGAGRHDQAFFDTIRRTLAEHGCWQGEVWNRRKSGDAYVQWMSITRASLPDEVGAYVATLTDITLRKEVEERMQYRADHDALTGMPNRGLFQDRLAAALAASHRTRQPFAVLFVDLDRFKAVNDRLGHPAGDALLIEAGARIAACARESDTVARFGGDEFAVILTEVGGFAEAEEVAQRICVALAAPFMLPQGEAQVASSVGIALSPTHGSDAATLEEHADQALYVAKRGGGNRWCVYSPTVAASAADRGKGRRRH